MVKYRRQSRRRPGEDSREGPGEDLAVESNGDSRERPGEDTPEDTGEDSREGPGEDIAVRSNEGTRERPTEDTSEDLGEDTGEDSREGPGEDSAVRSNDDSRERAGEDTPEDLGEDTGEDLGEDPHEDLSRYALVMATPSSDASTASMNTSQLVVEAEVHTNETMQRDLSEQISPVDNDKVLYNEDPDKDYGEHKRLCKIVNCKFTGAHIRTPSKQSVPSQAVVSTETRPTTSGEDRDSHSLAKVDSMTHDAEPYEAPRRHYSTAAVGIDVGGRTWRRGVSSEGWITVGKGHNQFGQTVDDPTGAVDPPLQLAPNVGPPWRRQHQEYILSYADENEYGTDVEDEASESGGYNVRSDDDEVGADRSFARRSTDNGDLRGRALFENGNRPEETDRDNRASQMRRHAPVHSDGLLDKVCKGAAQTTDGFKKGYRGENSRFPPELRAVSAQHGEDLPTYGKSHTAEHRLGEATVQTNMRNGTKPPKDTKKPGVRIDKEIEIKQCRRQLIPNFNTMAFRHEEGVDNVAYPVDEYFTTVDDCDDVTPVSYRRTSDVRFADCADRRSMSGTTKVWSAQEAKSPTTTRATKRTVARDHVGEFRDGADTELVVICDDSPRPVVPHHGNREKGQKIISSRDDDNDETVCHSTRRRSVFTVSSNDQNSKYRNGRVQADCDADYDVYCRQPASRHRTPHTLKDKRSSRSTHRDRRRYDSRSDSSSSTSDNESPMNHRSRDTKSFKNRQSFKDKDRRTSLSDCSTSPSPGRGHSKYGVRAHRKSLPPVSADEDQKRHGSYGRDSSTPKRSRRGRSRRSLWSDWDSEKGSRRHENDDRSQSVSSRSTSRHRNSSGRRRRSSSKGYRRNTIKVDKYDGRGCIETFLAKFESTAEYNHWRSKDKAAWLKAALEGGAATTIWGNPKASYEEMVEKLRCRYGSREQQEKFRVELRFRKRKQEETLQELAHDVERLVTLAYPEAGSPTREILGRDFFIDSLAPSKLARKIREREPDSLRRALTMAMKLEALHSSTEVQRDFQKPRYARGAQSEEKFNKERSESAGMYTNNQRSDGGRGKGDESGSLRRKLEEQEKEVRQLRDRMQQLTVTDEANRTPERKKWRTFQSKSTTPATPEMARELNEINEQTAQGFNQLATMMRPTVQKPTQGSGQPQAAASPGPMLYQPTWTYETPRSATTPAPAYNGQHWAAGYQWQGREQPVENRQMADDRSRFPGRQIQCYACGEIGHVRRVCPNRYPASTPQMPESPQSNGISRPARANLATGNRVGDGKVYVKVKFHGRVLRCLLDTGCDVTLIPAKLVKKSKMYRTDQSCVAANGTHIPILGWTSIHAWMGNMPIEIGGLVTEHVCELMLGIDWLQDNNVTWNFATGEISIGDEAYELESKKRGLTRSVRRVVLEDDVTIPPRSQMDVNTRAVFDSVQLHYDDVTSQHGKASDDTMVWGTESQELKDGLLVARTLLPNRVESLPVRLMNTTDKPIGLQKDAVISELESLQVDVDQQAAPQYSSESTMDNIIEGMIEKVDASVPDDAKERLRSILHQYSPILSKDELDLGWTDLITHRIDVGDNKPFRQQMRRYPPAHHEAIDKHLQDMLSQGVIEPATSPYASNIVLAKKKDGTLRCCIDFRQLNELTQKDAYPLPRVDSALDAMSGSKWFSTFDLRSGFHQVSVHPEDRDKTAFITRRGMFRFKTMPFGLCNAVATFQRLMDLVLTGLNLEICLVYLDDIIIFSATPEEHLERLERVLQRLRSANLKLKPNKCCLMQTSVHFLGHIVSKDGISTDPEKVKLIKEWPTPTNLKQLRGFLGLAGYYRKFVEGYAKMASPLNNLMKKNRRFIWTDECEEAFNKLKQALASPPILGLPNDEDVMILDTDACESSIGAVLSQVQNGQEKVIAYAGRALSRNEMNYCITRKELLSIVYFTKYFRQYLLGREFVVRTDHAALSWLRRLNDPIGQNARWLELLGEYDYIVKHRQGAVHGNADALSRHPCLNKPSCTACHLESAICAAARTVSQVNETTAAGTDSKGEAADEASSSARSMANSEEQMVDEQQQSKGSAADYLGWSLEELKAAQAADSDTGVIIKLLMSAAGKPDWKEVELYSSEVKSLWNEWGRLSLRDGVLCRRWTPICGTGDKWQIVLPKVYRSDFVKLVHTGMTGGHLGRSKTEEQVKQRAYWPNWRMQVAMELKKCPECAQYHRGKAPRQTPLQPFGAGEPFEIIAVDVTGKHPTSARGNQYIITVTDLFSKWSEAYPVRNHTAPVVAKVLVDQFFSRYGTPKRILSDLGVEFQSHLFQELCKRLEIEQVRTTPYKPSTNGCVERFHRTLNSMIGKVTQENQRDWDDRLASVMAAYRASVHSSTGFSPNVLVFGKENRMPVDLVLGKVDGEEAQYNSYDEYVEQVQRRMRESYELARKHLGVMAERRKNDYDIKVKSADFKVNQWVWYFYPRKYLNRSPKWTRNYCGPYLITKVIPPTDYVIQRTKKSNPFVVHGDKLKQCHGETPPSWLHTTLELSEKPSAEEPVMQDTGRKQSDGSFRRRSSSPGLVVGGYTDDDVGYMPERRCQERQRRIPRRYEDYLM